MQAQVNDRYISRSELCTESFQVGHWRIRWKKADVKQIVSKNSESGLIRVLRVVEERNVRAKAAC